MRGLLFLLSLAACTGLQSRPDAGRDAGGGNGGGGGGAGGGGGDAGGSAGRMHLPLRFADAGQLALQDITPLPRFRYENLWGSSAGDVLATNPRGEVQRFDGGTWSLVHQLASAPIVFTSVYVSSTGRMYLAADNSVHSCLVGCDQAASWKTQTFAGRRLEAICGYGALVYAVGWDTNTGAGMAFARNTATDSWSEIVPLLARGDEYRGCAADHLGHLYVAAKRYVIEHDLIGMGLPLAADLAPGGAHWNAIAVIGEEVVAVGEEKSIARRDADGRWSVVSHAPMADVATAWTAITPLDGGVFIGGARGLTSALARLDATGLAALPDLGDFAVLDLWAADDGTLFIAGIREPAALTQPIIYRARP